MANDDKDEGIVTDVEDTNDEGTENAEEKSSSKEDKPKRTPQEEYDYHLGRAKRLAKKHGFEAEQGDKPDAKPNESVDTSKPSDLDFGQKAFLKSYGVSGRDELALVKQFQDRGFGLDAIVEDDVFVSKLNNLRQARESANAVPKGKNRSGQSGISDVDLAFAKFQDTGELPADFETRKKVVKMMTDKEASKGMFDFK